MSFHKTIIIYYGIHEFNQIKPDSQSSIGIGDLLIKQTQFNFEFHVVVITEQKISHSIRSLNIELPGYQAFMLILGGATYIYTM